MNHPKEWIQEDMPDLNNKIAIVTGANTGLGFEDTRYLSRKGATVIMGCRDLEKGDRAEQLILDEDSNAKLDLMKLDLSSLNSVRNFSASVREKYDHVDILINNAGVMLTPFSRTELYRHSSFVRFFIFYLMRFLSMSAESGSRFALYAATAPEAKGGSLYGPSGRRQTKGFVKEIDLTKEPDVEWFTKENQSRLWKVSEEMTKIEYL
jgi:NAD(P)-dependent dehydrogenase (short-subunit alcohol dehydrogenase family)